MIKNKKWTADEDRFLTTKYPEMGKMWCVRELCRGEGSVRGRASKLGLRLNVDGVFFKDFQERAAKSKVGKKRPEQALVMRQLHADGKLIQSDESRKKTGLASKKRIEENGHPRGMLGKHHTEEVRRLFSKQRLGKKLNLSKEGRQKLSDKASKMMYERLRTKGSVYTRSTAGWFIVGNKKCFFRSTWEVVYARYLEWLKQKGEIDEWEYEPETFWFLQIKRGVRSYLPDFKVTTKGKVCFHEVKGWMDRKSQTKIKRMAKYYPEVVLIIIGKYEYASVKKWERMFPDARPTNR